MIYVPEILCHILLFQVLSWVQNLQVLIWRYLDLRFPVIRWYFRNLRHWKYKFKKKIQIKIRFQKIKCNESSSKYNVLSNPFTKNVTVILSSSLGAITISESNLITVHKFVIKLLFFFLDVYYLVLFYVYISNFFVFFCPLSFCNIMPRIIAESTLVECVPDVINLFQDLTRKSICVQDLTVCSK